MFTVIALYENEAIVTHTVSYFETREQAEAYKPLHALDVMVKVHILEGYLTVEEAVIALFD